MKSKTIALAAATLALGSSAFADVTVNITGATAFRVPTLDSIKARFVASGQPFKFAHDRNAGNNQAFNGATLAIFQGTFPGVNGTTTIRTSFNGSVEGIRALVDSPNSDPSYLDPSVLASITAAVGGNNGGNGTGSISTPAAKAQSDIAFSDVSVAATPFAGNSLQPASPEAGVVVFSMIANEGSAGKLDNLNTQNFRALYSAGYLPLSFFTGNANDTDYVFATGRNDGSGTRTAYLAETGYGIAAAVNQYVVGRTSGDTNLAIYRVPVGGSGAKSPVTISIASPAVITSAAHGFTNGQRVQFQTTGALPTGLTANNNYFVGQRTASTFQVSTNQTNFTAVNTSGSQSGTQTVASGGLLAVTPLLTLSAANASTVWGLDQDGNGGYSSGSTLRDDMGRTSGSVTVYDADGSELTSGANIHLVTWLSLGDAGPARTAGAVVLGYNGVKLSDFASSGTLSAADNAKVTQGAYTAWSFQQMYRRADITGGDKASVYDGIKNNLVLGTTGIAATAMNVGRSVDGGVVAP